MYDQDQKQLSVAAATTMPESSSLPADSAMDNQLQQHSSVSTFAFTGKFVVPAWLRRTWTPLCDDHVRMSWWPTMKSTSTSQKAVAAVSNRTFVSPEWLRQQLQALLQRYIHLLSQATKLGKSRVQIMLLVGLLSALCFWKRSRRQSPR
jgi:hypothetical protein